MNNRKWKRIIPIITSIILAMIAFIFGTFLDPFDYKALSSIPAFLFSIVVLLIGQIISIQPEVDKVSDTSDIICDTVKSYIHVTKIGTPKKAWEYVISRLPVMDYVQNTEYYGAAEPPVRWWRSHLSRLSEPPRLTTGYIAFSGSNP